LANNPRDGKVTPDGLTYYYARFGLSAFQVNFTRVNGMADNPLTDALFKQLDSNGDNVLSRAEVRDALDPDARPVTSTPILARDRLDRIDLVRPRVFAEAEKDHPSRAVSHGRNSTDSAGSEAQLRACDSRRGRRSLFGARLSARAEKT